MLRHSTAAVLSATTILCTLAGTALGYQPAPTAAPSAPAAAVPSNELPVIVLATKGKVAYAAAPGEPFRAVKDGDLLKQGGVIQTFPGAMVMLQIGAQQQLTIDKMTKVVIREAFNNGGVERTRIDLQEGRVRLEVGSVNVKNDIEVATPDAVAAVEGTGLLVETHAGFGTTTQNFHGSHFIRFKESAILARLFQGGKSSTSTPDPVNNKLGDLYTETNDQRSYDADEEKFVRDFIMFGPLVGTEYGPEKNQNFQATEPTYLSLNDPGALLAQVDLFGIQASARNGLSGFVGNPTAGTPFFDSALQKIVFLAVENIEDSYTGYNTPVIRILDTSVNPDGYEFLQEFPPAGIFGEPITYKLDGLAPIADTLFAHGGVSFENIPGQIFEIPLPFQGGGEGGGDSGGQFETRGYTEYNPFPTVVMNLGMHLQRGMAGYNTRGTVFVVGSLPGREFGLGSNRQFLLMELDPRANYIASALSNEAGNFAPSQGTQNFAGSANLNSLTSVTGLAMAGDLLVITGKTEAGRTIVLTYNPFATGAAGDPFVKRTRIDARDLFAAGGLSLTNVPQPPELAPAVRSAENDNINITWANMGYSHQAVKSGVVEQMARSQALQFAGDPAGCESSGALAQLGAIVPLYQGQQQGFGQVMAHFRENLRNFDPNHPCLPEGGYKGGGKGK